MAAGERKAIKRAWLFSLGITLVCFAVIAKLFYIQIVQGQQYAEMADHQYIAPSAPLFDRGSIYFKDKDGRKIAMATVKTGHIIAINPTMLEDVDMVYETLNSEIEVDKDSFYSKASRTDDPYEEITRRVDVEIGDTIATRKLPGVIVTKDRWRMYPALESAARTIGFVAYKGDMLEGRYGIERQYNDILMRNEEGLFVNIFAEIFSNIKGTLVHEKKSNRQGDIVSSIDPIVQSQLETRLIQVQSEYESKQVGGIIMEPKTGRIIAMANSPTFDLNRFNEVEDQSLYANPIVESAFEMGSIMKPITMAIGLDTGAVTSESTYIDEGYVVLDTEVIRNYDGRGRGEVKMQEILSQSLNTGTVEIMQRVGSEDFKKYLMKFGIGSLTDIDLPNETRGITTNLASDRDIELATVSFGQGIALSPIAMTRALAVLANGGILVQPRVIDEITYDVGFPEEIVRPEPTRVLSDDSVVEVSRMLVKVVDEALAGGNVAIDGYSVAAKTGTAQIASPDGGYYDDKFLHSFFGYFPAFSSRFIIFLYVVEPQEVRYASETLTEPFMDMTKMLINYYEIPPDR